MKEEQRVTVEEERMREIWIFRVLKWVNHSQTRLTVDRPVDRGLTESNSITIGRLTLGQTFFFNTRLLWSIARSTGLMPAQLGRLVSQPGQPKNSFYFFNL